jgi:hypothetical protein
MSHGVLDNWNMKDSFLSRRNDVTFVPFVEANTGKVLYHRMPPPPQHTQYTHKHRRVPAHAHKKTELDAHASSELDAHASTELDAHASTRSLGLVSVAVCDRRVWMCLRAYSTDLPFPQTSSHSLNQ